MTMKEADVRSMVADVQQAYDRTDTGRVEVTDVHIRQACRTVLSELNLSCDLRNIEFNAAMAAIRIAQGAPV